MAKKISELEIDLEKDILEGWQDYNRLNVELLKEARCLGHILPRVDIVKQKGIYQIVYGLSKDYEELVNYGGHSRAIVALQRREVLRCSLYDSHREDPSLSKRSIIYRPISELRPLEKVDLVCLYRLKCNLDFLPEDVRARFLKKNDLVLLDNQLITKDNFDNPPPF